MTTTIAPRHHGQCPACSRVEPLRPDGKMSRHREPSRGSFYLRRPGYCGGAGKPPVPGSIEGWLAALRILAELDPAAESAIEDHDGSAVVLGFSADRVALRITPEHVATLYRCGVRFHAGYGRFIL